MGALMRAIVSGHTQGLGAAIAAQLLARSIPVLGLARGHCPALAAAYPDLLTEIGCDLADTSALEAWLAVGGLDGFIDGADTLLLVNNAGMLDPVGPLQAQDPLAVARAVALNVSAPLMLAAALAGRAPQLRILHISSGAGRNAYPGWSVYGATKAALDHHARAVALDAAPGVRICSLAPGVIDTAMQAQIRAMPPARFPPRERFVALHRDGQLSSPEQAAALVLAYLLSASFGSKPVDDLRA